MADSVCSSFGRVLLKPEISIWDNDMSRLKICVLTSAGHRIEEKLEIHWKSVSCPVWVSETICDWSPDLAPGFRSVESSDEEGSEDVDYGSEGDSVNNDEINYGPDSAGGPINPGHVSKDSGDQFEHSPAEEKETHVGSQEMAGIEGETMRHALSVDAPRDLSNLAGHGLEFLDLHAGTEFGPELGPHHKERSLASKGPTHDKVKQESNRGHVSKKKDAEVNIRTHSIRDQAHDSSRSSQVSRSIPISLKMKDRLWGIRSKQQFSQGGVKGRADSRSKPFVEKAMAEEQQSISGTQDEVQNLIQVGGMMGYNLKGHEKQAREVIRGEEITRVSQ